MSDTAADGRASQKFVELAEKRVNRAIKDLQLIGNLANRRNYQYGDKEADAIIAALDAELKLLRGKFKDNADGRKGTFKLKR